MSVSLESLIQQPVVDSRDISVGAQLLSFLIVGGLGAGSFVALSGLMIRLAFATPSWIVSACCYALMILPVYLAHRRFSFRSDAPHTHALPRYVGVQLSGIAFASLFSFVCYGVFGMPTLFASLLVIGLTSGVNFIVLRLWAFAVPL
jgi:putative flippase GtrA